MNGGVKKTLITSWDSSCESRQCVCLDYSDVEFALILTDEDGNDLYEFILPKQKIKDDGQRYVVIERFRGERLGYERTLGPDHNQEVNNNSNPNQINNNINNNNGEAREYQGRLDDNKMEILKKFLEELKNNKIICNTEEYQKYAPYIRTFMILKYGLELPNCKTLYKMYKERRQRNSNNSETSWWSQCLNGIKDCFPC